MRPLFRFLLVGICLLTLAAGTTSPLREERTPAPDPRVTPDLREELGKLGPGGFIKIIIKLKDRLPPQAKARALAATDKKERRRALATALRAHAQRSQRELLSTLKTLEARGLVRKVRPIWIANVIGAEIQEGAIAAILRVPNVDDLRQDVARAVFQQAPPLLAWGVDKIEAEQAWNLGFTGQGVVVAVVDTGIDLHHPDLDGRLWRNPDEQPTNNKDDDGNGHIDDVHGWDFIWDDETPNDENGHGTTVAGVIAGDGTGGESTGVAPGAQLMVLKISANQLADQLTAWDAMGYALEKAADIINLSLAWKDWMKPDYAEWRLQIDDLTDAGILVVAAAGNDSPCFPEPCDIHTPGRVPRAITVGATNDMDLRWAYTSQGPITWQGVSGYQDYIWKPGLRKPDVSAPGVDVRSTQAGPGGGYTQGSGTSLATPHVSGTAALLLQEDPALLPHETAFIIREMALDLGTCGDDNVYGWGRVDAFQALTYNYAAGPLYDLSVTGTNSLWTTDDIWVDNNNDGTPDDPEVAMDNKLYARIRNIGGRAVGNVKIEFYYADVGTIGISGFDPDHDGDPRDGNFKYIDSYFVPIIGPAGSDQDTAVGVVKWNMPAPVTDHWCVGIGIVAPDPPNLAEQIRTNNTAFRNFFRIVLELSEIRAFSFYAYPDPRRPGEPFDLEFSRRGLPQEFQVEVGVDERLARQWFERMEDFQRIEPWPPTSESMVAEADRQAAGILEERVGLVADRGVLRGIVLAEGKPVLVRLLLGAPRNPPGFPAGGPPPEQLLVINARNQEGVFGGLAVKVELQTHGGGLATPGGSDSD